MAGCKDALPTSPHLNFIHILFYCALKILHFFKNKLKVYGSPMSSKSSDVILPTALHFN